MNRAHNDPARTTYALFRARRVRAPRRRDSFAMTIVLRPRGGRSEAMGSMNDPHARVHESVQADAVLQYLAPRDGDLILDGTLGAGGHALRVLQATATGRVIGLDRDPEILAIAKQRLEGFAARARFELASFERFDEFLGDAPLAGALLDLGVSSLQIDRAARGFSYREDGPLDMRMDASGTSAGKNVPRHLRSAADLLNKAPADELYHVLRDLGDEPAAKRIVAGIVEARGRAPLRRTCELRDVVAKALRRPSEDSLTKSLSRVFMGIRMAVNDELGVLERTLPRLIARLAAGGRLVVLSFHGGEDRVVKRAFLDAAGAGLARVLTDRPLEPTAFEVAKNPRARSSKLRALERVATDRSTATNSLVQRPTPSNPNPRKD